MMFLALIQHCLKAPISPWAGTQACWPAVFASQPRRMIRLRAPLCARMLPIFEYSESNLPELHSDHWRAWSSVSRARLTTPVGAERIIFFHHGLARKLSSRAQDRWSAKVIRTSSGRFLMAARHDSGPASRAPVDRRRPGPGQVEAWRGAPG